MVAMVQPAAERPAFEGVALRRRWRADEVLGMVAAGMLADDEPVELLDGELWMVSPQGPEHRARKVLLHERLAEAYRPKGCHVSNQDNFAADEFNLPEPDLSVVRGAPVDFVQPAIYARAGVPVYWLLDLEARRLIVHSRPDAAAEEYLEVRTLVEGDEVALPELDARWRVGTFFE
jgi:Uma2 family endonuclease